MPWISTESLSPDHRYTDGNTQRFLSKSENHQVYNGLDNCLTFEVNQSISQLFSNRPRARRIYEFEKELQGPYLEMMNRGFKVDSLLRRKASIALEKRIISLETTLNQLSLAARDKPCNPRSSDQLKDLFYNSLRLPEIWTSKKGIKKLSLDRDALEKLSDLYFHARPFVWCILRIRDLYKQKQVFDTEIDSDGRFRSSYNIAGTETGRPSSSGSAFGTGGNAQNIAAGLRYPFVADTGKKIGVIDLEQVEARDVGWICGCLFGDWSYLDSCESGDLHTNNAILIWPELPWTQDPKLDRAIADRLYYREFTYRDISKRGGHLSNYMGTAWTAAKHLKCPLEVMEDFQHRYCRGPTAAFSCISKWWQWTAQEIQTKHLLVTPFGRERHFFGWTSDDATLREAIAFQPQSTTADRTNLALYLIWRYLPQVQLLAQTFDSVTFQYNEGQESYVIPRALELMQSITFHHPSGRSYTVPGEAKVGWNWGNFDPKDPKKNPEGLMKWSPSRPDTRTRGHRLISA